MKKLIILVVIAGILIAGYFLFKGQLFGGPVMMESYVYSEQDANFASVSWDGGTDEIITGSAHGLLVGDAVIFWSGIASATLGDNTPNISDGTRYFVVTASSSTAFEISTTQGGSVLDVGDTSSANGDEFVAELIEGRAFDASEGEKFVFSFCRDATASANIQFVGSVQTAVPDFYAARSLTNRYDTLDAYDLQSATSIDGDTGISTAAAADCTQYQAFGTGLKWISAIVTKLYEGSIDVEAQITN